MTQKTPLLRCARTLFSSLTILCLLALASAAMAADLRLASSDQGRLSMPILSDHMVLQRDQILPIWGEGVADSRVGLELRDPLSGRIVASAFTRVDGERWRVDLPPLDSRTLPRVDSRRTSPGMKNSRIPQARSLVPGFEPLPMVMSEMERAGSRCRATRRAGLRQVWRNRSPDKKERLSRLAS